MADCVSVLYHNVQNFVLFDLEFNTSGDTKRMGQKQQNHVTPLQRLLPKMAAAAILNLADL